MSSAAATKAIASLASNPNFLNPGSYASVTEVAAAALTPLFSAAINSAALSGAIPSSPSTPSQPNAFQPHLPVHHSRPASTTAGGMAPSLPHTLLQQQQQQPQGIQQSQTTAHQTQSVQQAQHTSTSGGSYLNPVAGSRAIYTPLSAVTQPHPNAPNSNFSPQSSVSAHSGSSVSLNTKSTHAATNMLPIASRLPSGHLHHPTHLGTTHLTAHGFHGATHGVAQSGAHQVLGHASLPQGSGVLRQQTKEPAYHPQVSSFILNLCVILGCQFVRRSVKIKIWTRLQLPLCLRTAFINYGMIVSC